MALEELDGMKDKVTMAVAEAYGKYQSHARSLSQVLTMAKQHEFLCNVMDQGQCVQKYEAFKPTVFASSRGIAKKFRDCVKGCTTHTPYLLQLKDHKIANVEELRHYEAAAKCFSQCVDTVYPDFKRAEQEIRVNHDALQKKFPVE